MLTHSRISINPLHQPRHQPGAQFVTRHGHARSWRGGVTWAYVTRGVARPCMCTRPVYDFMAGYSAALLLPPTTHTLAAEIWALNDVNGGNSGSVVNIW